MTGRLPPVVELRKESQQSLSPDQLASYIKVSKPSVWLLMGAIAALLVAGIAWFFAGTITENAFGVAVVPGDGADAAAAGAITATVYLPLSGASGVEPGDAVTLACAAGTSGEPDAAVPVELTGTVLAVSETPVSVSEVRARCAGADFSAFAEDDWAIAVSVGLDASAEPKAPVPTPAADVEPDTPAGPDVPASDTGVAPDAAPCIASPSAAYNASIATAQHRPIRLLLGLE